MNGYQYEQYCANYLRANGYFNVTTTPKSKDQGVDIIAYKKAKKYGIQCKYYSNPVGNRAVQEAYSGAKYYNCDCSIVMTNSTFTQSAKDLAKKTNVKLMSKIDTNFASFFRGKKIFRIITILLLIGLILNVLGTINSNKFSQELQKVLENSAPNYEEIINQSMISPKENDIINKLRSVRGIKNIINCDSNNLTSNGAAYVLVFDYDKVDNTKTAGITLEEKGNDAGGTIEVFLNKELAKERDATLSIIPTLAGKHTLIGTVIIRTSAKLSSKEQRTLRNNILEQFLDIKIVQNESKIDIKPILITLAICICACIIYTIIKGEYYYRKYQKVNQNNIKNDIAVSYTEFDKNQLADRGFTNKGFRFETNKNQLNNCDDDFKKMESFMKSCNAYVEKESKKENSEKNIN